MKYTPKTITEQQLHFSIPIYQRLFEWTNENVKQLLDDLYKAYTEERDYYVGMLTSNNVDGTMMLVDGQQRFTVMMLLGCVLQQYESSWKDFLLYNDQPRLYLASRVSDQTYLFQLIQHDVDSQDYVNLNMQNAIKSIIDFMQNLEEKIRNNFATYVYEHLSFFITKLPSGYNAYDLNKYFERMNCSGKNLEQHEILKVKIISQLDDKNKGVDISLFMQLWNKLADVDTLLIRKRTYQNEKEQDLTERKNRALGLQLSNLSTQIDILNGLRTGSQIDVSPIADITPSPNKPKSDVHFSSGSRSVLRFPYLLLQTLYYFTVKVKQREVKSIQNFFNANNLLETFQEYLPYEGNNVNKQDLREFLELLMKCRIRLDLSFIRTLEYGYSLDMNAEEGDEKLKELLMFESFLYVASSNYTNYRWFGWLMDYMLDQQEVPQPIDLFKHLYKQCKECYPLPDIKELTYNEEVRFWFWRLDFYIWQHRNELFSNPEDEHYLKIASNYIFTRSRSIEHIAPQQPKTESRLKWDPNNQYSIETMNSFGNLCMISQSLNSTLSNSSFEVKRAHVESFFTSVTGTIESLKLLMAYHDYKEWNIENIQIHGEKMYELLKNI